MWHAVPNKRLTIVLLDAATAAAFRASRFGSTPRVDIITGSITEGTRADAYISPANTSGNMDGGVDRVFADFFGWSYGRPYHTANPLQQAMDCLKLVTLPIGQAIVVRDGKNRLIASPTMVQPGKIPAGSQIVHDAARAAFVAWRHADDIETAKLPSFGTGWGEVPPDIAAEQMWGAFVGAWAEENAEKTNENDDDDDEDVVQMGEGGNRVQSRKQGVNFEQTA
jgi:O-acetyl-ADP-ribose deacetylase (regulator of RNase III)